MASNYDNFDLAWVWNGDFSISNEGDLEDTTSDALLSIQQDIQTVVASAIRDWELNPRLGASLEDFIGEPNTRETGDSLHDRIRISLTAGALVKEQDLKIKVVPVHIHRVLIIVAVNVLPSVVNGLDQTTPVVTRILFDYLEQGIYFLGQAPKLLGDV